MEVKQYHKQSYNLEQLAIVLQLVTPYFSYKLTLCKKCFIFGDVLVTNTMKKLNLKFENCTHFVYSLRCFSLCIIFSTFTKEDILDNQISFMTTKLVSNNNWCQYRGCKFFFGCHKKNEKCDKWPYIYHVHTVWRWEILKLVTCLWLLLLLSNRPIVDFFGWRGQEGHKNNVFLWTW